ncbi:MAG TPA: hypothetical protein VFA63_16990 [Pseudonocardiaceae bacterium]|nr:hypothetical protein [Pseudonocardiaceae bacterium]
MSVHCDQCGHILGLPERAWHFRTEGAAINAAITDRWRIGPDGQWWCAICAPALICQADGHQFTPWRCPQTRSEHPAPSEYRYCRRCCVLEDRPAAGQSRRNGGEPR